jgi:CHAT domain-containing protein
MADLQNDSDKQLQFLLEVLQSIEQNDGDPQVIHPLFLENLTLLNDEMISLINALMNSMPADVEKNEQKFIALTIWEFGKLIQQFPLGNKPINVDISISCYNLALQEIATNDDSELWSRVIQHSLANAYLDRIKGDRAENLEKAIKIYESALEVYTKKNSPTDWAVTQNGRASAYSERIKEDKAENLEKAIEGYQSALEIYTKENFPTNWANTQNNLANAYSERIKEDKVENLEKAIEGYQSALEIYTKENFPTDWANTQNNLANAYKNRIKEDKAENLERAIMGYQSALEIHTKENFPIQWATIQNNLAIEYSERTKEDRAENLEKAIEGYQSALEIRTKEDFPIQWANTQNNLANAYKNRIKGDRAKNLENAITSYESALEIRTKEDFPIDWANSQENIAIFCIEEGKYDLGIEYYNKALEIFQPKNLPASCLKASRGIGNIYYFQGNWSQALHHYETAIQSVETIRNSINTDQRRQETIAESLNVYEKAIQCAINLQQYDRAIQYCERGRSRQLVELMHTNDLFKDGQIPAEIQPLYDQLQKIQDQIDRHQPGESSNDSSKSLVASTRGDRYQELRTAVLALEDQKQQIINSIRQLNPIIANQIAIASIDFSTIQTLITTPATAILYLHTTDTDTHIFIISPNTPPQKFTIPTLGQTSLHQWLHTEWSISYAAIEQIEDPADRQIANQAWQQKMPHTLQILATKLQLPQLINQHLQTFDRLIIIPHKTLHQIPWTALPSDHEQQKCPDNSSITTLGDRFTITTIPSAQILSYCSLDRPGSTKTAPTPFTFGIVQDAQDNLPGAKFEGEAISQLLTVIKRLSGSEEATVEAFQQMLASGINGLHSSQHGYCRFDRPTESALLLADGKITVGQLILSHYPELRQVFLSACETNLGHATTTDDLLTLATGFICAGASTVISSLWRVDDLATALCSIFYYRFCSIGKSPAVALQKAQQKLRQLSSAELQSDHAIPLQEHLEEYKLQISTALQNSTDATETKAHQKTLRIVKTMQQQLTAATNPTTDREVSQQENHPFADTHYWAGFGCQGLG